MRAKFVPKFRWVALLQAICGAGILIVTFTPRPLGLLDPDTKTIIDLTNATNTERGLVEDSGGQLRPIVAQTTLQLVLLAVSRFTGFSLYPVLVLTFLSKCKALATFVDSTPLSMFSFTDPHELHVHCGRYIAFDVWIHMGCHLARWVSAGNHSLFWEHRTSETGLAAAGCVLLIAGPMLYLKKAVAYEIRKLLHFLFVPMAVALCYHVPTSAVPNGGYLPYAMAACLGIYALDFLYVNIRMTEKIDTTTFQVLPTGVQMTFEVSESFRKRCNQGGYVNVCLPWVGRTQWHAFSVYEFEADRSKRQVFIMNVGDWTQSVHTALQRSTVRPVWIQGPFSSPYSSATRFDNQILVATGIGITPALSVISSHKGSRRVNLIWMVRDPAMLEFFMERTELDEHAWNLIFYTGTVPLSPALDEMRPNVRIFKCRPQLHTAIPNIIYGIESGEGLPDFFTKEDVARQDLAVLAERLDEDTGQTNAEKLKLLNREAKKRGYCLQELVTPTVPIQVGPRGRETPKMPTSSLPSSASPSTAPGRASRSRLPLPAIAHGSAPGASQDGPQPATRGIPALASLTPAGNQISPEPHTLASVRGTPRLLAQLSDLHQQEDVSAGPARLAKRPTVMIREVKNGRAKQHAPAGGLSSKRTSATSMAGPAEDLLLSGAVAGDLEQGRFEVHEPSLEAQSYVLGLDPSILATWGILYCGQCAPVAGDLSSISDKYKISLATESFSW